MSEKVQLSKLQQISNDELTALQTLNDNFKKIENQFDNMLSRTNESPNNMESDLDMDQHSIINVKSGKGPNDVVVRKDIQDLVDKAEDIIQTADKVLGRVDEKTQLAAGFAKDAAGRAEQAKMYRDDSEHFAREASFAADRAQDAADRAEQGGQTDPTVFARKLDDNLHQEVSDFGTYNGQEVQSGEVFVGQDGRLWQYTKQQEDNPQGLVWESISQNTPASSDFPVLGLDDGLGRIVIPHIDSQYVTISDDYGHNWRREFLNTKFSGTAGSVVAKYHNNVVHTGTQYVYFGTQSAMVSQDGVEWDSLADYFDNNGNAVVLQGVTGAVYFNGVYVLSDSSGQVYYSHDGVSLDKSSITDGRITMSPGNFVLCVRGSASMTSGELLSISHDGINWITRSPEGSFPAPETQAVSNGITIVQCAPCYSEVSAVNVSPDGGLSWTSMPLPFICKPRLSYIGGKFIILQNDEQSDVFLWSEDGYTWNTEYLMALGTWRTVCFSAGVWSFLGDLDTIVASSWNTGGSTGSTYHSLQLLSYNEVDILMLLQQTGLEASKVDMLTAYNLQTVLFREEGTLYIANDTFNYEPIGVTGLYSKIHRGHIYKLQSDDNGLMHLIDITPEPEIEQQDLTPYVRHLDTEHAEQIVLDGTYDGQNVEDKEVFVQHDGKLMEFNKTLNPGGDWGTSTRTAPEYVNSRGLYGKGVISITALNSGVSYSKDKGRTWSYVAGGPGEAEAFGAVNSTFNGEYFIANNGSGYYTSDDAITWRYGGSCAGLPSSSSSAVYGFEYGNGVYVLTRQDGNTYYSTDGINWNTSTQMSGKNAKCTCFANGKFVAITSTKVYTSENGADWVESSKPSGNGIQCAGGNGVFVISDVGSATSGSSNKFFYSTDGGMTWKTSFTTTRRFWCGLTWCGDRFFAVSHKDKLYTYSFDGINWIEGTMPWSDYWYTVTYADGEIVVTCGAGVNKANVAYVSFRPFYEYSLLDLTSSQIDQKVFDNVGRGIQLVFNGTLSGNTLTFEVPTESSGAYSLKHLYNYEIDLLFEAVGQLDDSTQIVIMNDTQQINIVNAKHDNHKTPVTVGDMKQIMKYSTDIGFRWIFDARYTVTTDGQPVFVMPSTVTNSPTTQDGVTVFEGDNHPVVIKGQAGTTATGLQVQDSLQAGSAVDFEHYRSGDQYGIQFTVDNSKSTTGSTQYWRSYVTDAGVSVTDFTTQQNVLVPTEALTTIGNNAASTQWVKDYIDSRLAELG